MNDTFANTWNKRTLDTTHQIFDMVPQSQLDILSQYLINQNGLNFQISICMEEISELATELILDNSFENTASEIADVYITLNHVTYGYNIRRAVDAVRNEKLRNPRFMSGNDERMIALLELQKELLKHMNRRRDNMPIIIDKTADAYIALAKLIIGRNNLPLVQSTAFQKIQRTFQREK